MAMCGAYGNARTHVGLQAPSVSQVSVTYFRFHAGNLAFLSSRLLYPKLPSAQDLPSPTLILPLALLYLLLSMSSLSSFISPLSQPFISPTL